MIYIVTTEWVEWEPEAVEFLTKVWTEALSKFRQLEEHPMDYSVIRIYQCKLPSDGLGKVVKEGGTSR